MPIIKVYGQELDVDIRQELEVFPWTPPRWSSDKLIAASPFRYDHTPSFVVNLDGDYEEPSRTPGHITRHSNRAAFRSYSHSYAMKRTRKPAITSSTYTALSMRLTITYYLR